MHYFWMNILILTKKIAEIDQITQDSVMEIINCIFDFDKVVTSYVGKEINFDPLKIIKD